MPKVTKKTALAEADEVGKQLDFDQEQQYEQEVAAVVDFLVETVWSRHMEGLRREKRTLEIQLMAHRLTRLAMKYNALSYATRGLSADLQASACATARKEWREASDRAAAQFPSELCVSCLEPICQCQCASTCPACGK